MISTWVWDRIPGPAFLKAILVALVLVAVVLVLFEWVFPWVSTMIPVQDPTVGDGGS
ncbi:hypothetical protein [Demequina sp. NBRC 110055]|uniref:hypothetical protein n=1 Tax=Demequina sp. NBRC 110055 TaxID=1570344 RepID=UPI0013566271|nr:hypothetical protein [Demequina sp. NBRC 110055]